MKTTKTMKQVIITTIALVAFILLSSCGTKREAALLPYYLQLETGSTSIYTDDLTAKTYLAKYEWNEKQKDSIQGEQSKIYALYMANPSDELYNQYHTLNDVINHLDICNMQIAKQLAQHLKLHPETIAE